MPDTGKSYNKTLNMAGNLLQHTSACIQITWAEGIAMQKKVWAVIDVNNIVTVRDEVKN